MPTLTERLLFASRQCYEIVGNGPVPDAADSDEIGWIAPPVGYVSGPDIIDAGLIGEIPEAIVVAFRGTLPPVPPDGPEAIRVLIDWVSDFDALLVSDPTGLSGRVHQGFMGARDSLWGAMGPAIAQRAQVAPGSSIFITGHSKGGAVANLAAARLLKEVPGTQIYVCTFAAARSGDPQFATAYDTAIAHSDRYEYQDDIVPHVPLTDAFAELAEHVPLVDDAIGHLNQGFESVGRLYFIDWSNNIVSDSRLLRIQRFTHLAERFAALDVKTIAGDHSIDPGSGYADAPYV